MYHKVVYKITYPNGKIYIGQDVTNDINYYGSPSKKLLEKDFPFESRHKFTIIKEIIFSIVEDNPGVSTIINQKEIELIKHYESNNLVKGYNLKPKFTK